MKDSCEGAGLADFLSKGLPGFTGQPSFAWEEALPLFI
jgi:hypothetical protein